LSLSLLASAPAEWPVAPGRRAPRCWRSRRRA